MPGHTGFCLILGPYVVRLSALADPNALLPTWQGPIPIVHMGLHDVSKSENAAQIRRFTRHIMQDMRALEYMLENDMFETDIQRVGAEQELFLVDRNAQPAPLAEEVLELATDERIVNELTRFNLEINLDPLEFTGTCFSTMEADLNQLVESVRKLCGKVDTELVLTGILPTIHAWDLRLDNMAPKPRYYSLNDTIMSLKGGLAQYHIRGVDELFFQHDNIMVEGCNTSFQVHLQVTPDRFAHFYNIAQLVSGPILAAAANSPILFGKRLWRETRIALFQQAVDTRSSNLYLRDMSPRVHFGTEWVNDSVLEIFQEDIARFRVIMTSEYADPFEALRNNEVPKLRALQLHNGTVYRWNRACYGISGDQPHLRIENRLLPSGPTVVDEVANAAFWTGLVYGLADEIEDVRERLTFDDAKSNFIGAARRGLASEMDWVDDSRYSAPELIRVSCWTWLAKGCRSEAFATKKSRNTWVSSMIVLPPSGQGHNGSSTPLPKCVSRATPLALNVWILLSLV